MVYFHLYISYFFLVMAIVGIYHSCHNHFFLEALNRKSHCIYLYILIVHSEVPSNKEVNTHEGKEVKRHE